MTLDGKMVRALVSDALTASDELGVAREGDPLRAFFICDMLF